MESLLSLITSIAASGPGAGEAPAVALMADVGADGAPSPQPPQPCHGPTRGPQGCTTSRARRDDAEEGSSTTDEEGDVCHMDSLPDELLLDILSRLPVEDVLLRVPLVCRRWARVIQDGDVWRDQELQYYMCSSDREFAKCLQAVPRLARLDLSGIKAGSAAERSVMEELQWESPNERGLDLVLSDEMDPDASVMLVERMLKSLVSLHVGHVVMKFPTYCTLVRLLEEAPRLRDLRLRAGVHLPPNVEEVYYGPQPEGRQSILERIELSTHEGDMAPAVQAAVCRLIRANQSSLRFVSHEHMSMKRPVGAQERGVMTAIAQCENLESARVWSSHFLKDLEGCKNLRSLALNCDGECHLRMEEQRRSAPMAVAALALLEVEAPAHGPPNEPPFEPLHWNFEEGVDGHAVAAFMAQAHAQIQALLQAQLHAQAQALQAQAAQAEAQAQEANEEAEPPAPFTCLEFFSESPLLPQLRQLCLRFTDCQKVSPLVHLAARCPDLEELTLRCSTTDTHLNKYLKALIGLRRLTLIGVHYLPSVTLYQWTPETLPNLHKLTLIGASRFCPHVCWAGPIMELRSLRPNLRVICKECEHFRRSRE